MDGMETAKKESESDTEDRDKGKERDRTERWRFNTDSRQEGVRETGRVCRDSATGNALGSVPSVRSWGGGHRGGSAVGGVSGQGPPQAGPQGELLTPSLQGPR